MPTKKQKSASNKNIKKAQAKWKGMSKRQHSLAQPQGRGRKRPGMGGEGKFYRITVRPKQEFVTFRTQDVGKKGGLERVAGRRSSGSWDTATWLVAKKDAHVSNKGELVITDPKAKTLLKQIRGKIIHLKGDIFHANPLKNVPEKDKPTVAQKKAQRENIKKAQNAKRKK